MTARIDRRGAAGGRPHPAGGGRRGAGNTLLGVFIGVVIGLAIAAAVAFWLLKAGNPYQPSSGRDSGREIAGRGGRAEPVAPEKPRFDFYKILPGGEEPKVQPRADKAPTGDRATLERAASPNRAPAAGEAGQGKPAEAKAPEGKPAEARAAPAVDRFWLQAGSFANAAEAENLKARLALAGWEADVQEANVPDKGVRYRVRLGPYDNTDELNRIKGELVRRGFDVAVLKY